MVLVVVGSIANLDNLLKEFVTTGDDEKSVIFNIKEEFWFSLAVNTKKYQPIFVYLTIRTSYFRFFILRTS